MSEDMLPSAKDARLSTLILTIISNTMFFGSGWFGSKMAFFCLNVLEDGLLLIPTRSTTSNATSWIFLVGARMQDLPFL